MSLKGTSLVLNGLAASNFSARLWFVGNDDVVGRPPTKDKTNAGADSDSLDDIDVNELTESERDLRSYYERRKVERKREQDQAQMERLRLDEILRMCTEYEQQIAREKELAAADKARASSSSGSGGCSITKIKTNGSLTSPIHVRRLAASRSKSNDSDVFKYEQPNVDAAPSSRSSSKTDVVVAVAASAEPPSVDGRDCVGLRIGDSSFDIATSMTPIAAANGNSRPISGEALSSPMSDSSRGTAASVESSLYNTREESSPDSWSDAMQRELSPATPDDGELFHSSENRTTLKFIGSSATTATATTKTSTVWSPPKKLSTNGTNEKRGTPADRQVRLSGSRRFRQIVRSEYDRICKVSYRQEKSCFVYFQLY